MPTEGLPVETPHFQPWTDRHLEGAPVHRGTAQAQRLTAILLAGIQLGSLKEVQQNSAGQAGPGLRVLFAAGCKEKGRGSGGQCWASLSPGLLRMVSRSDAHQH